MLRQGENRLETATTTFMGLNWDSGEKFWWRGFDSEKIATVLAVLAFVFITAVWGSTFFLIKDLVSAVPPLDFLGTRFVIAAVVVLAVRYRALKKVSKDLWGKGMLLGTIFMLGQLFQVVGLQYTDASVSGFITGMYVVLTPIVLMLMFGVQIPRATWVCIAIATGGLMVLTLDGLAVGFGELLTLLGALLFPLHIVVLGHWTSKENALDLTVIQLISMGGLGFLFALPGGVTLPSTAGQWASLLYMAFVASLLALFLQTWAQAHINPTSTAIIFTLEPLFAAAFAVAFGGESLTFRLILGGTLIVAAMAGAELLPIRIQHRREAALVAA